MSKTVCNLHPGAAWTISLDVINSLGADSLQARGTPCQPLNDEDVYPLPPYGMYTPDTIEECGGAVDMPTNHLLEEISAILPTPDGISTGIPLFIIPQGHNVEPPLVPRKARTRKPSEVTEDDLVNLNPVVKHRYPSRARKGPDYLHK